MFALRKISSNGGEINFDLGDYYSLITKERSPEEFEDKMKDHPNYDEAYAFIYWKDGVLPFITGQTAVNGDLNYIDESLVGSYLIYNINTYPL